jgi:5,5'-dehydrodivanillate O-demethylase
MLTEEANERLARVGAGTPMGELLRRYWHPVAIRAEMDARWTKRVRLLGEDLVLFRDRSGRLGLIGEACPHRRASLAYGIPTAEGIRCPYHGWQFDGTGACTEQPNEPAGSTFKDKVRAAGYPVRELGGLVFAYLGPAPAPVLPQLDGLVAPGTIRAVGQAVIPCNWLQIMENSLDPVHTEWLHGHYFEFQREDEGVKVAISRRHVKWAFDEFPYGIVKRRLLEGQREDCDDWTIGHPVVFPTTLALGNMGRVWREYRFQFRVPVDDERTLHYWYSAFVPPPGASVAPHLLDRVHAYDIPLYAEDGSFLVKVIYGQDVMAWATQGAIADRSREALGTTDTGIIAYRQMLERELANVAAGRDPKNVVRDPARDVVIELPLERMKHLRTDGFEAMMRHHFVRFSPIIEDLVALYKDAGKGETAFVIASVAASP